MSKWYGRKNWVVLVGGTHGNEPTGYHLVREYQRNQHLQKYNFECSALVANPLAVEMNKRYVDFDLNRSFRQKDIDDIANLHLYESTRALHLSKTIGRDASESADVILDLHNTTANTGVLLLMSAEDIFSHQIAEYVKRHHSADVKLAQWDTVMQDSYLPSIGKSGMTVEVGPVPQGCLTSKIYHEAREAIELALEFIEKHNETVADMSEDDILKLPKNTVESFRRIGSIDYPRDREGDLIGMVHANLQDRDFIPLEHGDLILERFDGSVVEWDQTPYSHPVYPYFINESAYYEKEVAFAIAQKVSVEIPDSLVKE